MNDSCGSSPYHQEGCESSSEGFCGSSPRRPRSLQPAMVSDVSHAEIYAYVVQELQYVER